MQSNFTAGVPKERRKAIILLIALQRSIPIGVFNPKDYWTIFENRLRASAIQNIELKSAFEQLKMKLKIDYLKGDFYEIIDILEGKDSKKILEEWRNYPSLLVTYVRLEQQKRKEDFEKEQIKKGDAKVVWPIPEEI